MGTFDWVQFPEGRARFSGGVRGADELGHETFAIDIDGEIYYGEVRRIFLPNGNDFNIEIVSIGWPGTDWIGMSMPGMCHAFSTDEIDRVKLLIVQLIKAGASSVVRPNFLNEYSDAHFMGQIFFRDGWSLHKEGETAP